jgi:hypothetical protein
LILLFSYWAARDLRWLWGVSAMIFMQYATDHYDGKLGKYRGTGLVRWGYYMDHLLDYFFPVCGDHRVRLHPSGTLTASGSDPAGDLFRAMK